MFGSGQAYNTAMRHPNLVVVKTCGNRIEAELVKGALENAGIQATTQADTVGRMREHIAWSGAGFQVLVRERDLAAALDALTPTTDTDFEDGSDPGGSWRRFT